MLYGIKGVAKQISNGSTMIKWAVDNNNLEHKFDNFTEKSNSTMADTRDMMEQ